MVAAAVVGSAAVGAVGANVASNRAAGASERASERASEASQAELDFAKERYADWKAVFGDLQENLAEYYENLSPELIETQGIQAIEQERALALQRLDQQFTQRGIGTSGLAKQAEADVNISTAQQRAQVRAEAPMRAAQEQSRFLQIGLGQNPAGSVQQSLARRTGQANLLADQRQREAFGASAAANQAITDFAETGFNYLADTFGDDNG